MSPPGARAWHGAQVCAYFARPRATASATAMSLDELSAASEVCASAVLTAVRSAAPSTTTKRAAAAAARSVIAVVMCEIAVTGDSSLPSNGLRVARARRDDPRAQRLGAIPPRSEAGLVRLELDRRGRAARGAMHEARSQRRPGHVARPVVDECSRSGQSVPHASVRTKFVLAAIDDAHPAIGGERLEDEQRLRRRDAGERHRRTLPCEIEVVVPEPGQIGFDADRGHAMSRGDACR